MSFLQAVAVHPFLQFALLAGLAASVCAGVVGTYVVARRIAYLAGSISHFVLAGMGAARYFQVVHQIHWLSPLLGALIAACAGAMLVSWVSMRWKQREDSVIGAMWAFGMAVGVLFMAATPGYNEDLMSYLFGNILMVSQSQLWLLGILDAVIVALGVLFYHKFLSICFDDEFAKLRGINTHFYYTMLLLMTSITVVVLTTVVGLILVIALLTLPAAAASTMARRLWQMMWIGAVLCALAVGSGVWLSFELDWPAGATIIVMATMVFLVAQGSSYLVRKRRSRAMQDRQAS